MDRLYILTASHQKQNHKIPKKISENIFEGADHHHKDIGVVHQFTERSTVIVILMWVQCKNILCLLKTQSRFQFCFPGLRIKISKQHRFII